MPDTIWLERGEAIMANSEFIQKYADEFLEKIFYFCLKKCSNPTEAEDLSSEIGLNIIQALNDGQNPEQFHAWVWTIARNRYSKWAIRSKSRRENRCV